LARPIGSITVFRGYRVQHHFALCPTKAGTRFAPKVDSRSPQLTLGDLAANPLPKIR